MSYGLELAIRAILLIDLLAAGALAIHVWFQTEGKRTEERWFGTGLALFGGLGTLIAIEVLTVCLCWLVHFVLTGW